MNNLRRLVPLALTAALLLATIYVFRDQIALEQLSARFAAVNLWYLAVSVVFFLAGFAGAVYRNKFVIDRATGSGISFKYLFLVSNFSYTLGYVAPVSIAAEVLRIGLIKSHLAISYTKSLRLVVIDKFLGFTGMAVFAILFIPLKVAFGVDRTVMTVEGALLLGFFLLVPLVARGAAFASDRFSRLRPLMAVPLEDWQFLVENFSDRRDIVIFMLCSTLAVGGFSVAMVLVAAAMQLQALALIFAIAPTILLVQNIPLFYAGFGAREAMLLLMLGNESGADPNQVLGFSMLVGVMLFASAIPATLGFFFRGSRHMEADV